MRKASSALEPTTPTIPQFKLGNDSTNQEQEGIKNEMEDKRFSEKLWLFGKSIGHTKGIFRVKLGKSIHQMGVGLMTENGIKFSTSLILEGPKSIKTTGDKSIYLRTNEKGELPEKFKELMKHKNDLIYFETSKSRRSAKGIQERERLLKLIIDNLQQNTGYKSSSIYDNEFSLIRAQDLLLVLLMH